MSEDAGIRTRIERVWEAAEALRIVDFNGNVLCEAYGDMKREVFDKLMQQFKDAHEIRERTMKATELFRQRLLDLHDRLRWLQEGDNGVTRPDKDFLPRTLDEAKRIIQELLRAVSALAPSSPASGWRDIETAPKDIWILAGHPDWNHSQPAVWSRASNCWVDYDNEVKPTHWQPLPAPPPVSAKEPK